MQAPGVSPEDHGVRSPNGFLVAIIVGFGASAGGAFLALEHPSAAVPKESSAPFAPLANVSPTPVTEPTLASEVVVQEPAAPGSKVADAPAATPTFTATPAPYAPEPASPVATLPADIEIAPAMVSLDEQARCSMP